VKSIPNNFAIFLSTIVLLIAAFEAYLWAVDPAGKAR
jgi:hypothetical protein